MRQPCGEGAKRELGVSRADLVGVRSSWAPHDRTVIQSEDYEAKQWISIRFATLLVDMKPSKAHLLTVSCARTTKDYRGIQGPSWAQRGCNER